MTALAQRQRPGLSIETFRAFYESRPNEEHWELIDGVPTKKTPATFVQRRITSNFESVLNDALDHHDATMTAYQRLGMNLKTVADNYDPEPDVVIVDSEGGFDQRYQDRFYLAAEIVSDSDAPKMDLKREIYRLHPHCRYVVSVRQDRIEVRVDARTDAGWEPTILKKPDDVLALPAFGLRCNVADFYRGTPLQPRRRS
jgi:Uma2 family endonuclease